jgi:ribokinase
MSLAIVGGTVVDVIFPRVRRLPAWPNHTESTPRNLVLLRDPPIVTLGGNGANAAYVAARCGAAVTLHTQIGRDTFGHIARCWLEEAGCCVRTTSRTASTAVNMTAANLRHERAMFFHPGAPIAMPARTGNAVVPRYLLVCGWPHPPLAALARGLGWAKEQGTFTALDAGPILGRPWTLGGLRTVLAATDLFLTNDYELKKITRSSTIDTALAKLRRLFAGHVVVKRGADGVLWQAAGSGHSQNVRSPRVRVINTVGAGDSFNGALLAALASDAGFPSALRGACVTAASVVASPRGILGVRQARFAAAVIPFRNQETSSRENLADQF